MSVAVGDLNGDRRPDLAVVAADHVAVLLGNRKGGVDPAQSVPAGVAPTSVAIADLNEDSHPDLAVADYGSAPSSAAVLLGDGNGGFGTPTAFPTGMLPQAIAVGDLDLDGHLDLVTADIESHGLSVLVGDGTGRFGGPLRVRAGVTPVSVAVGDLDQDGRLDLAAANFGSHDVSVLLNRTIAASRSRNGCRAGWPHPACSRPA